jgi:hypothetical protein
MKKQNKKRTLKKNWNNFKRNNMNSLNERRRQNADVSNIVMAENFPN